MGILRIGHIPVGMEMFHAGGARNLTVIRSAIKESDCFVLAVGARLGSKISKEQATAYIEWEYNEARKLGLPIFVYLLETKEYEEERNSLTENDPERSHDQALRAFRQRVQQAPEGEGSIVVEFFSKKSDSDLANKVTNTLLLTENSIPGGWIRHEQFTLLQDRISLDATVSKNPFFKRFAERLNDFHILSGRTLKAELLKKSISSYFWKLYLPRLALQNINSLFFESGSSIAYIATEFIHGLRTMEWTRQYSKDVRLYTNNILIELDFVLMTDQKEPVHIEMLPKGEAEHYYGATFGQLIKAIELPPPIAPRPIHSNARKYLDLAHSEFKRHLDENALILMAASGFELDSNAGFFGPHARSYYNMLLKRTLLDLCTPTVLLLDEAKLPSKFVKGQCFPVLGPDLSWDDLVRRQPFAIATCCSNEEGALRTQSILNEMQLAYTEPIVQEMGAWPLIAGNELFHNLFAQIPDPA